MDTTRHNLTDETWNKIKDLLPSERTGKRGRPAKDNRMVLDAILWLLRTGAPWRDLPAEFGSWKSVYTRFRRWKIKGVWETVFTILAEEKEEEGILIDSSIIQAHQHAAGAKGGSQSKL